MFLLWTNHIHTMWRPSLLVAFMHTDLLPCAVWYICCTACAAIENVSCVYKDLQMVTTVVWQHRATLLAYRRLHRSIYTCSLHFSHFISLPRSHSLLLCQSCPNVASSINMYKLEVNTYKIFYDTLCTRHSPVAHSFCTYAQPYKAIPTVFKNKRRRRRIRNKLNALNHLGTTIVSRISAQKKKHKK